MTPWHYRIIFSAVGLLLFVAVADLPFDFYRPLRITVATAAVFLIVRAKKIKQPGWYLPAGLAVLLFPPGFGFTFPKATWIPIDIAFGLVFLTAAFIAGKPYKIQEIVRWKIDGEYVEDYEDLEETLEMESNKPNLFWALVIIALSIYSIFQIFGTSSGGITMCPNYVQDEHGGYCEGLVILSMTRTRYFKHLKSN
jgi:hypothetical protein